MNTEIQWLPAQYPQAYPIIAQDERIIGRPFGFGFGRPFGFGFGVPFLGGLAGGLLAGSLLSSYGGYGGYGYPYGGYGYPYGGYGGYLY